MPVNTVQIATNAATAVALFQLGQGNPGDGTFSNVTGAISDELPAIIRNLDATNTVWIGDDEVTAGTGFPIKPGESFPITFVGTDAQFVWAIAGAGTPTVAVFAGRQ